MPPTIAQIIGISKLPLVLLIVEILLAKSVGEALIAKAVLIMELLMEILLI